MAIQYAIGLSDTTTETPEILATDIRRIRGVSGASDATTQTNLALTGRDRSPDFSPANSETTGVLIPHRRRRAIADSSAATATEINLTAITPSLGTPSGELFLDTEKFADKRLARNKSYYIGFYVDGKRLSYEKDGDRLPLMEAKFYLHLLDGTQKVRKTSNANGVVYENFELFDDGTERATGTIILKPSDVNFATKEIELSYRFCIGKGSDSAREHLIEFGHLIFY